MTKFQGQKIQQITGPKKQRLWIAILNKSYFDKNKIEKGDLIGYPGIEPKHLKIYYEKNPPVKARRPPNNYLSKDWSKTWKATGKKRRRSQKQTGGS